MKSKCNLLFKRNSVVSLFLLFTFSFLSNIQPISENSAKWWGAGTGVATGAIAGTCSYFFLTHGAKKDLKVRQDNLWFSSENGNIDIRPFTYFASVLFGVGTGALTGYLVYQYLLNQTPQVRYLSAKEIVRRVLSDSLISSQFKSNREIVKQITFRFGTNWPLVLAREYFEGITNSLRISDTLLDKALLEAEKDTKLSSLCKKCTELKQQIPVIVDLIIKRMNVIIDSADYKFQVKLYQTHAEELKRREHESKEREKDRWTQYHIHSDKINQKEKDRKLKENILNTHGKENVAVNVNI